MTMVCPVIKLAASEARKTTTEATSDGLPMRPSGTIFKRFCNSWGLSLYTRAAKAVSIYPGYSIYSDTVLRPLLGYPVSKQPDTTLSCPVMYLAATISHAGRRAHVNNSPFNPLINHHLTNCLTAEKS